MNHSPNLFTQRRRFCTIDRVYRGKCSAFLISPKMFGSKFDIGATFSPFCATGTWVRVTKFSVTYSANVCFDGFWWSSPITCLLICLRPGVSGKFPSVSLRRLRRARVTAQIVVFAWWSLLENFPAPMTYSLTRLKAIGVGAGWRWGARKNAGAAKVGTLPRKLCVPNSFDQEGRRVVSS